MTSEEVSAPVPDPEIFAKEYKGAKPKATLPLRVLDEEVWLSGSELKTDNSSSDEEKPGLVGLKENRAKKGARRKTKCIKAKYSKTTKSQFTETNSKLSETCEVREEMVSSSDDSDFDYEEDVKSRKKQIDLFMKKIDEREEFLLPSQIDVENTHIQKLKSLQEEIKKAERNYKVAKKNTDAMISKMAEYLESMSGLSEPEWIYFVDITKKWIACFRKTQPYKALQDTPTIDLNENNPIQENLLQPKKRYKARKLVRNYGNLKNKKVNSLRLKKTEEIKYKKTSLDIVLARIETESKESSYNEPYKLTIEELNRIHEIENKLDSFRSCNSLIESPNFFETNNEERQIKVYSDNFVTESPNLDEEKEKNDEHESEKIDFPVGISFSKNCGSELDEFCNESANADCNSVEEDNLTIKN